MSKLKILKIEIDPNPKGKHKRLGGSEYDDWNNRHSNLVASALPVNQNDMKANGEATTAIFSGMIDINPADPVEAILVGQLITANEAALSMYRRAWQQPSEYFEARTRYLALADKAARTVALLTERLDQHRGRGQQQITVKHVTVNADQAMVADTITTGKTASNDVLSATNLLTAGAEKAMPMEFENSQRELVNGGGGAKTK
jgi:hypothetical protein